MTKTKKTVLSISIATLALSLLTLSAFAAGPPDDEQRLETMEAMHQTFENNDYDAWVGLVSENPRGQNILEQVNEDNFERFAEAHMLMFEGKEILDELGIEHHKKGPGKMGHKDGPRNGQGGMMKAEMLQE